MLKFDSWPPEAGNVDFTDDAFDVIFQNFHSRIQTRTAARSVATLLRDNCDNPVDAVAIFIDLRDQLPESGVTDATNGVDDIMHWNPRQEFACAGDLILEPATNEANTEGVTA
jgi:hypothetical protein